MFWYYSVFCVAARAAITLGGLMVTFSHNRSSWLIWVVGWTVRLVSTGRIMNKFTVESRKGGTV